MCLLKNVTIEEFFSIFPQYLEAIRWRLREGWTGEELVLYFGRYVGYLDEKAIYHPIFHMGHVNFAAREGDTTLFVAHGQGDNYSQEKELVVEEEPYWTTEQRELVSWFQEKIETGDLPQEPFRFSPWGDVVDPQGFYNYLLRHIGRGPGDCLAVTGEIEKILKRLRDLPSPVEPPLHREEENKPVFSGRPLDVCSCEQCSSVRENWRRCHPEEPVEDDLFSKDSAEDKEKEKEEIKTLILEKIAQLDRRLCEKFGEDALKKAAKEAGVVQRGADGFNNYCPSAKKLTSFLSGFSKISKAEVEEKIPPLLADIEKKIESANPAQTSLFDLDSPLLPKESKKG